MRKQFIIILITYIIARLVGKATGIYFSFFSDEFDLALLIKDFMIWIISYTIVTLIVSRFYKQPVE